MSKERLGTIANILLKVFQQSPLRRERKRRRQEKETKHRTEAYKQILIVLNCIRTFCICFCSDSLF